MKVLSPIKEVEVKALDNKIAFTTLPTITVDPVRPTLRFVTTPQPANFLDDEKHWKTVVDFTQIKKGGIDVDELLTYL